MRVPGHQEGRAVASAPARSWDRIEEDALLVRESLLASVLEEDIEPSHVPTDLPPQQGQRPFFDSKPQGHDLREAAASRLVATAASTVDRSSDLEPGASSGRRERGCGPDRCPSDRGGSSDELLLVCQLGASRRTLDPAERHQWPEPLGDRLPRYPPALLVIGDQRTRRSVSEHPVGDAKEEEAACGRDQQRTAVAEAKVQAPRRPLRHAPEEHARQVPRDSDPAPHPGLRPDAGDRGAAESQARLLEALTPAAAVGRRCPQNQWPARTVHPAGLTRRRRRVAPSGKRLPYRRRRPAPRERHFSQEANRAWTEADLCVRAGGAMRPRRACARSVPRTVASVRRAAAAVAYEEASSSCERNKRECAVDRPSPPRPIACLLDQCLEIGRRSRRGWAGSGCDCHTDDASIVSTMIHVKVDRDEPRGHW